jgi:hypothetical protein
MTVPMIFKKLFHTGVPPYDRFAGPQDRSQR